MTPQSTNLYQYIRFTTQVLLFCSIFFHAISIETTLSTGNFHTKCIISSVQTSPSPHRKMQLVLREHILPGEIKG